MFSLSQTKNTVIFILLLVLGIGLGFLNDAPPPAPPLLTHGTWLTPKALPTFQLDSTLEKPFHSKNLVGHWTLVYFGFRQCDTICMPTLHLMSQIAQAVNNPALQYLFVNIDPNDTVANLKNFLAATAPDCIGVQGSLAQLKPLATRLGAIIDAKDSRGGIAHSGQIYVMDPKGEWVAVFSPPFDIQNMVSDMGVMMRFTSGR